MTRRTERRSRNVLEVHEDFEYRATKSVACICILYSETFATAAFIFHIRVVKFKAFVQTLFRKVQLRAIDVNQTLGVYNHLYAMALK